MVEFLKRVNELVWGIPALAMILLVGIYLTVCTGAAQFRLLPRALRKFFRMITGGEGEGKSSFRCLCTALGATVGTGNLVGVAGAICLGGPGSIFWMWICGLLGMVTKYAEVVLAMRYRVRQADNWVGGPMYVIQRGLGERWKPLGMIYCFLGVFAAFGVGNATQINALTGAMNLAGIGNHPGGNLMLGLMLSVLVWLLLSGGVERIGRMAENLVPLAAGGYILICVAALLLRREAIPGAFGAIFRGAFNPAAVTGGALGSAFCALRVGCARGVFTNEAGMGTASMAHAESDEVNPSDQGMMGIVEVFLDTIVICTLTALVILTSGAEISYGVDAGNGLTGEAFRLVLGHWSSGFLACAISCFAIASILGWGYYGLRCAGYLLGPGSEKYFVLLQALMVIAGAVLKTGTIWLLAEIMNGLMAIPNLLALMLLSRKVVRLTPGCE